MTSDFKPADLDIEIVKGDYWVQTLTLTLDGNAGLQTSFVSLEAVKFKRKILPGEILNIHAELESFKRGIAKGSANSNVNGESAVSATFTIAIPEIMTKFRPLDIK